jgi:beta-lactam-binding protein with PASTA domain
VGKTIEKYEISEKESEDNTLRIATFNIGDFSTASGSSGDGISKGNGTEVIDQMPRAGQELNTENGVVVLYTEGSNTGEMIVMPDLTNMSPTKVSETLSNRHLNISVDGIFNDNYTNSYVYSQSVPAGTLVAPGTIVHVEFRYNEEIE